MAPTVASVVVSPSGTASSSPTSAPPPARMLSHAALIRSSAASTRLSSAITTGRITTSKITLPIHHNVMTASSARCLVGGEEPAEHPQQGHLHRPKPDRETTCRSGRDVGGLAPLCRADLPGHVGGEIAHQHGSHVGDHAAAVLGSRAG